MQTKVRQLMILIGGFFLFCLDQIFKYLSLNIFTSDYLAFKIFGWNPFINHGIAFSLPLPNIVTLIFTIPVVLIILWLLIKSFIYPIRLNIFIGLTLIFWGSISNLLDRIIYKATIDYFLIATGVINIADILIVIGFLLIFFKMKK
jgi:lipoprotein signal peptidase